MKTGVGKWNVLLSVKVDARKGREEPLQETKLEYFSTQLSTVMHSGEQLTCLQRSCDRA